LNCALRSKRCCFCSFIRPAQGGGIGYGRIVYLIKPFPARGSLLHVAPLELIFLTDRRLRSFPFLISFLSLGANHRWDLRLGSLPFLFWRFNGCWAIPLVVKQTFADAGFASPTCETHSRAIPPYGGFNFFSFFYIMFFLSAFCLRTITSAALFVLFFHVGTQLTRSNCGQTGERFCAVSAGNPAPGRTSPAGWALGLQRGSLSFRVFVGEA